MGVLWQFIKIKIKKLFSLHDKKICARRLRILVKDANKLKLYLTVVS